MEPSDPVSQPPQAPPSQQNISAVQPVPESGTEKTIKTPLLIGGFAVLLLFISGLSFLAGRGSITRKVTIDEGGLSGATTIPTTIQEKHDTIIPTSIINAQPTTEWQISPNPTFPLPTAELQSTVRITGLNPQSGPVGTRVIIYGSGFTSTNNVYFNSNQNGNGVSGAYTEPSSQGGTVIYFTIPEKDNPTCPNNTACPIRAPSAVIPGEYRIGIFNSEHGLSNQLPFTVTP